MAKNSRSTVIFVRTTVRAGSGSGCWFDVLVEAEAVGGIVEVLDGDQARVFLLAIGGADAIGLLTKTKVIDVDAVGIVLDGGGYRAGPGDGGVGLAGFGPTADDGQVVLR